MNSNRTYCGKSCETCPDRARLGCPGCQEGPGRPGMREGCPIAVCCREKNHESCDSCTNRGCMIRDRRENMVERREADALRAAAAQARRQEIIALMNKYLPTLWGVTIARLAIGLIAVAVSLISGNGVDGSQLFLGGIDFLMGLAIMFLLAEMASAEPGYKTAAIFLGITTILEPISNFLGESGIGTVLGLLILAPSLYATYSEYKAHENVLYDIDEGPLAAEWARLWKLQIGAMWALLPGFLLAFIMPVLVYIGLFIWIGVMAYIAILDISTLYKTKNAFRDAGR